MGKIREVELTEADISSAINETEKEIAYIDRCGNSIWSGGWAEIGNFDPIHLFPPES